VIDQWINRHDRRHRFGFTKRGTMAKAKGSCTTAAASKASKSMGRVDMCGRYHLLKPEGE